LITSISNPKSIDFLDITLFIENEVIKTRIYQKQLNRYDYTPKPSHHPNGVIKGFIIGELIRYIRLTTRAEDYLIIRNLFFTRLFKRGYKLKDLYKFLNHENLLKHYNNRYNKSNKQNFQKSPDVSDVNLEKFYFVIRYSDQPEILTRFRKHFDLLGSQISNQTDKNYKICISFKKNKNIGQILCNSGLTNDQKDFIKSSESPQQVLKHTEISNHSDNF
jgi:hypothetical protein